MNSKKRSRIEGDKSSKEDVIVLVNRHKVHCLSSSSESEDDIWSSDSGSILRIYIFYIFVDILI